MKLIRITDKRYILDCGPDVTARDVAAVQKQWEQWWLEEPLVPTAFFIGGVRHELEYEDARATDIEKAIVELKTIVETHKH